MANHNIANKNLTLIYQNLQPNLEMKLFVNGQLTYLLEKCPVNSNLSAKLVDCGDHFLVQLNLASHDDLLFASAEEEVMANALETAISEMSAQMRFSHSGSAEISFEHELF